MAAKKFLHLSFVLAAYRTPVLAQGIRKYALRAAVAIPGKMRGGAAQASTFIRTGKCAFCLVAIDAAYRQNLFVRELHFEHIRHQAVLVA